MIVNTITLSEEMLLGILLIAGTVFFSFWMRQWMASKGSKGLGHIRLASHFSFVTLGVALLTMGVISGPVPAKEIFAIPSSGGYEFYQLDSSIQRPMPGLSSNNPTLWPSLQTNQMGSEFSFTDSKVKESSLIVNPGYRTSLTNRIITVAGRIAWDPSFVEINLINPLHEKGSLDIAKLNIERLTGVYETAWVFNYDLQMNRYN